MFYSIRKFIFKFFAFIDLSQKNATLISGHKLIKKILSFGKIINNFYHFTTPIIMPNKY